MFNNNLKVSLEVTKELLKKADSEIVKLKENIKTLNIEVNKLKSFTYGVDNTPEGLVKFREELNKRDKELAIKETNTKVPELEKKTLQLELENKYLNEYLKKLENLNKG